MVLFLAPTFEVKKRRKKVKGKKKIWKYVTSKWTKIQCLSPEKKITMKLHEKRSRFILKLDLLKVEFSKRWNEVPVMGHMMIWGG